MDDEDSQDELINKNASHGKGKRPVASIFSDEEENSEDGEDSQGGETDSEVDEDDASEDGEEEDGMEEDEEESEHEDAEKDLQGAVGSTSADLAGLSSDEDAEKCPICLNSFHEQPVATPESCEHYFCLDCILEWAKNANSCPVDRIVFSNILLRKCYGGKVQKTIMVKKTEKASQEEQVEVDWEQTTCEVCGGSDREDRLLLCDGCDAGYHMECLTPPLNAVPVEEWFCPECVPNTRRERSSEDESNVLPTTSRSQPSNSRPTRAIARTQHSERVRRNVNRHRITQARTAAQLAPRYLMQSTWLDETINAVVAGLNTAVYVRDLTPRPQGRRRRKTVRRRKTKKDGKAAEGKKSSTRVRRRKRRVRRTKSKKKLVVKKTTTRGRIAQSLGMKKPVRSSSIPSVYRPSEQTLGSMRADIGAASLSIYGDPFDLDPFDDQNEEVQQTQTPSSLLEAKRRGLSRSAMRSHQPVARPISAGLPRRGHSIPQIEEVTEPAPVPDLLGSILSGQSMLLMDSSDIVINRDGSLKATKPVNMSLPRNISSGSTSGESSITSTGASPIQSIRETQPSSMSSTPLRRPSSNSPTTLTPVSPSQPTLHTPASVPGLAHLHTPLPHRPVPSHPAGTEHGLRGTCGVRGHPPKWVPSGASDSRHGERGDTPQQIPAKKPPPKPVWVDVSVLPRIPKIKRESSSEAQSNRGSNSNNLPESSMTSLAGDKGRQHTVDQQRASASRQSRTPDSHRQRLDRPGPSSSFSNSFSTSSSSSVTSNARPSSSSSSTISFRINASGNPWHARRFSAPEQSGVKDEESAKRTQKDKQMLLLSHSQAKKASVKSEVYDPFNPTGSDSSESESESDSPEMDSQSTTSMSSTIEQNERVKLKIKTEPVDFDPPYVEENTGMCIQVKQEPASSKKDAWPKPLRNFATGHRQVQSESLAAVMAYSGSPAISDAELSASPESPFTKAFDRSRSSSTSSQHSGEKVKMEIKGEPDEPSPVKSTSEPDVPKGNGLCDELPSVASSSDVSHNSIKKEIASPRSQPETERVQAESTSQSSPSKDLESSPEENEHLWAEDRKHSSSGSPGCRQSRSKSKERRRSHSRSKERSRSRSRSKERSRSRSRSKERSRSRSRSKERRHSSSRSKERRHSRSRSKEKRRSRSRSKGKKLSRSRSKEKRRSRSRSKERRRSSSRSKEKRRSRSRSKGRRRSRSRSKGRRHSRSRSKDRRRSRSRSLVRRRSRSKSKERRHSRSRSKERKRSRSKSRDKRRSRSKERRRSHSGSRDKRGSRSRSKERKHSRSQDKRCSARSSSIESSRKKKAKHSSRDHYDGKGKDANKKSKEKRCSRSRSRSRSIERRREQPSSHRSSTASKDKGDMRSKSRRSGSSSRDQRRRVDVSSSERKSEALHLKEKITNKYLVNTLDETKETISSLKKNFVTLKKETESGENTSKTEITAVSIKKENEPSGPSLSALIDTTNVSTEKTPSDKPQLENTCILSEAEKTQLQKDIKIETEQSNTLFEELINMEAIKKEESTASGSFKTSQEFNEICILKASTPSKQTGHSLHQEEKSSDYILDPPKQVKKEQLLPYEEDGDEDGGDEDPYSDDALVINLSTPDPALMDCDKELDGELTSFPVVEKEKMEEVSLQASQPVKQEPVDSSDEEINVDYLIDNLDFIKKELKEDDSVTDPPGTAEPHPHMQEPSGGVKQEIEPALIMGGTKAKSQGKRVTWNIQEPEGPPPEKMSKLALFKLKLKQEGSRKAASTTSTQSSNQDAASVQLGPRPAGTSLHPPLEEGQSDLGQGGSKSSKEDVRQDSDQKDKYMKKLHMQERAVEEVKLAIKPFYQKRDITKEEYKEILRKAVQKVCHSKSGEINPVKVANLVKAYVDKYKHARKHRTQNAEGSKDSETPG